MTDRTQYLVIGPFAPSHDPAASTAMAVAHALSSCASITCLIDDLAADLNVPETYTAIRRSHFEQHPDAYKTHKRIYCLGNSFESLFALELLHQYPGIVITHDQSYHDLILALFQSQQNWPENYTAWLMDTLGENGRTISHTLLQHRRLSAAIGAEIHDHAPLGLHAHTEITLAHDQLFPFVPNTPPAKQHTQTVLCVGLPAAIISAVNTDLKNLGQAIRLVGCDAGAPELVNRISSAAMVVLDSVGTPSPALSLSLSMGKPIIIAGSGWRSVLPDQCHLRIETTHARHALVAAIGSVILNTDHKEQLAFAAKNCWASSDHAQQLAELIRLVGAQTETKPNTENNKAVETPAARTVTAAPVPDALFRGGANIPTALIGSVPATSMIAQLLPGIDTSSSPRFATPTLAHALTQSLSGFGRRDPHSLLAHLGFETPIVRTVKDDEATEVDLLHVYDWPTVQTGLKQPSHALTFNAEIIDVPTVQQIDPSILTDRYGTEINFADSLNPILRRDAVPLFDRVAGHLATPGLFWELDRARRCLHCIMIVGLAGRYQLTNMHAADSVAYMVTNSVNTQHLADNNIMLSAGQQGILSFSIRAVDARSNAPRETMFLLKSLAETTLKLEWSSHE